LLIKNFVCHVHAPPTILRPEIPAQLPNSYSIQTDSSSRTEANQSSQIKHVMEMYRIV